MSNILVTGFGSFGKVDQNPSAWLAEHSGERFDVLEVRYQAVDSFLADLDESGFDAWLMMGVHGYATGHRLEFTARNVIGATPDVLGCATPGVIDPAGVPQISSPLWNPAWVDEERGFLASDDAGAFLCNYLFYQGLRRFPNKRIGFLHVPPFSIIPADQQLEMVRELLGKIALDSSAE